MKTLLITTALLMHSAFNMANAACIPPAIAEIAVAGRTYIMKNSHDPRFPIQLTFGSSKLLTAGLGTAFDGQPAGTYRYRGNCHGHIIVTFTSDLPPDPQPIEVLHLQPIDADYDQLKSIDANGNTLAIFTNAISISGIQPPLVQHSSNNRYKWLPNLVNPTFYICWDDKTGIEVADSYCLEK